MEHSRTPEWVDGSPTLDLMSPDTFAAGFPHEHFRRLREEDPVSWHPATSDVRDEITNVVSFLIEDLVLE